MKALLKGVDVMSLIDQDKLEALKKDPDWQSKLSADGVEDLLDKAKVDELAKGKKSSKKVAVVAALIITGVIAASVVSGAHEFMVNESNLDHFVKTREERYLTGVKHKSGKDYRQVQAELDKDSGEDAMSPDALKKIRTEVAKKVLSGKDVSDEVKQRTTESLKSMGSRRMVLTSRLAAKMRANKRKATARIRARVTTGSCGRSPNGRRTRRSTPTPKSSRSSRNRQGAKRWTE